MNKRLREMVHQTLNQKSVQEGEGERQSLAEAAKSLNAPGIKNLLKMLGADETKK